MKVIVVYEKGAWRFYAFIKNPALLKDQLSHLELNNRRYQVLDVETSDFHKIELMIDKLND